MPANQDDDNLMIMTMIMWQVYAPPEWVGEHHYHGEALSVWELGMITQVIINYTSTKRSNWGFRWDLAAYDHTRCKVVFDFQWKCHLSILTF